MSSAAVGSSALRISARDVDDDKVLVDIVEVEQTMKLSRTEWTIRSQLRTSPAAVRSATGEAYVRTGVIVAGSQYREDTKIHLLFGLFIR